MTEKRNELTAEEAWVILQKVRNDRSLANMMTILKQDSMFAVNAINRSIDRKINSKLTAVGPLLMTKYPVRFDANPTLMGCV